MNEQEKAAIATLSAESGLASQELQATLERLAGAVQTAKEDGDNMTYALKGEDRGIDPPGRNESGHGQFVRNQRRGRPVPEGNSFCDEQVANADLLWYC